MKKNLTIYFLCASALLFGGCNKEEELNSSSVQNEGKDCLVTLNMAGEITTSESVITKGSTAANDLYTVQVYNGLGPELGGPCDPYAFGIFDDPSLMKLKLKQGSSYTIYVNMIADAKTWIDYYSPTNNGIIGQEYDVFALSEGDYVSYPERYRSSNNGYYIMTNQFFYNSDSYYKYYSSSSATSSEDASGSSFYLDSHQYGRIDGRPNKICKDWFNGVYSDYTPTGEFGSISIPLKRVGYKIKYEISGITDGTVSVRVMSLRGQEDIFKNTFTADSGSYASDTKFVAYYFFNDVLADLDNYSEDAYVDFKWVRGSQELSTFKAIKAKRNCLNNIKINLDSDTGEAGIGFSVETETMGSESYDISVE